MNSDEQDVKTPPSTEEDPLPPDPVIEAYKKDIDRASLRENLKLTVDQRLERLEQFREFVEELQNSVKTPAHEQVSESDTSPV